MNRSQMVKTLAMIPQAGEALEGITKWIEREGLNTRMGALKYGGKGLVNIAGWGAYHVGVKPLLAAGAIGAMGVGAYTVAGELAKPFEMIGESNPGPIGAAASSLNPSLGMNYGMLRSQVLVPGFGIAMGAGLIGGAMATAATYSRPLPPYTRTNRVQRGEQPYNLGASGEMVLGMNNMR